MNIKYTAEILVREHLIVISNLNYEYGIHADLDELKNDPNFKKAIECAKLTLNFKLGKLYGMGNPDTETNLLISEISNIIPF